MTDFAALVAAADLEVFGRLGGPVTLIPADESGEVPDLLAIIKHPVEVETLRRGEIALTRREVHIPVSQRALLRKGDVVIASAGHPAAGALRRWRIAEAPLRPGRGFVWIAEIEDLGPVA